MVIFTIAFWGTESKLLSYEKKLCTVQKYEMLPFGSKQEAVMLLEQEEGCAINPAAVSFCLPGSTREP